ncbi:CBD9-like protein, partial [Coniochaeta ligniaria NRRL 30616]
MGFVHVAFLVLGASGALAGVTAEEKRQEANTIKYCPGSTTVCFSEFLTPTSDIVYRIAIPDVPSAPFDILLQIVAPISTTGWAGLAWGGSMTKNPLTIGWATGSSALASSRWATGHTLPQPYIGATYTVLPTSTTNATHWQLDVLCSGCSQWSGLSLNPNGPNTFAWAKGSRAVTAPSSNISNFAYHDDKGVFSHDLSLGKIPKGVFDALV